MPALLNIASCPIRKASGRANGRPVCKTSRSGGDTKKAVAITAPPFLFFIGLFLWHSVFMSRRLTPEAARLLGHCALIAYLVDRCRAGWVYPGVIGHSV